MMTQRFTMVSFVVLLVVGLAVPGAQAQEYDFELMDNFGFMWLADAGNESALCDGIGYEVAGTVLNAYPQDGRVDGYVCKTPRTLEVTAVNNAPDGCELYSDSFTYTGMAVGPNQWAGDWTSFCDGEVLFEGTWTGEAVKNFKGDVPPPTLTVLGGSPAAGRQAIAAKQAADAQDRMEVVSSFALEQNFPNPFNPTTLIAYELAEAGPVSVRVYNALGQEVARLVDGFREAGRHEVRFDASELSAGVYLYAIEAEGFRTTRQMTLLK